MPEWQPSAILTDACDAEITAVEHAFMRKVLVFLCHWHVQRSWKKQLYLKVIIFFTTRWNFLTDHNCKRTHKFDHIC